jgi:hypothetical protein
MQKWRNWEAATELDWLLALRRESVIAPLAAQSKVGLRRVDEAALQLGLRRSAIYDLLKRYGRRSEKQYIFLCPVEFKTRTAVRVL